MGKILQTLSEEIQSHIKGVALSAGFSDSDDVYETMAQVWLHKYDTFRQMVDDYHMVEVDKFQKNEKRGAIALTYSGSLILFAPKLNGSRKVHYNSIGLRKNKPKSILEEHSVMADDLIPDRILKFETGPVSRTSKIFKVVVCKEVFDKGEEESEINQIIQKLIDEFIRINNNLVPL